MVKWIFFDLDGVLIDSKDWHFQSLQEALKKYQIYLSREEHDLSYDGLPTLKKLEMLSSKFNLSDKMLLDVYQKKQELFCQLLESNLIPSDPIKNLLLKLKDRKLKLAVCSNAIRKTVAACLAKLDVDHLFDFYLSNQDVAQPKPSPEIYLSALKKAKIIPEEAVIVEDSTHGIESAKKTGCHLVVVKNSKELTYDNFLKFTEDLKFE